MIKKKKKTFWCRKVTVRVNFWHGHGPMSALPQIFRLWAKFMSCFVKSDVLWCILHWRHSDITTISMTMISCIFFWVPTDTSPKDRIDFYRSVILFFQTILSSLFSAKGFIVTQVYHLCPCLAELFLSSNEFSVSSKELLLPLLFSNWKKVASLGQSSSEHSNVIRGEDCGIVWWLAEFDWLRWKSHGWSSSYLDIQYCVVITS